MIYYFLLALSTVSAASKALLCKVLGVGGFSARRALFLHCRALFMAFVCSLLLVIGDIRGLLDISAFSFLLSVFFGFSMATTQFFQAKAMGKGPASMVSLIYSCGLLIPIFYGLIFWDESVSLFQWIGVGLLFTVMILMIERKEKKSALIRWVPFAVVTMLGSGANAVFQKTHQYSAFSDELPFFLVYSLFFSAAFMSVGALLIRETQAVAPPRGKGEAVKSVGVPLCLGICVCAINFLNLTLSAKLPSVVLFPVCNIGSMLLTTTISAVIYKDKPTPKQALAFLIGIVAILMIGLL